WFGGDPDRLPCCSGFRDDCHLERSFIIGVSLAILSIQVIIAAEEQFLTLGSIRNPTPVPDIEDLVAEPSNQRALRNAGKCIARLPDIALISLPIDPESPVGVGRP